MIGERILIREIVRLDRKSWHESEKLRKPPTELPNSNIRMGLEFEFEQCGLRYDQAEVSMDPHFETLRKWFTTHSDGSLRGNDAIEFVFRRPFGALTTEKAVAYMLEVANARQFAVSRRTGLHVHVNMGSSTMQELRNLCTLYAILEPSIYHAAGGERVVNPFCTPWFYDCGMTHIVTDLLLGEDRLQGRRDLKKYSGLNLNPLFTQGSVEFRHPRNSLDIGFVYDWISLIINLYNFAHCPTFEDEFDRYVFRNRDYRGLIDRVYRDGRRKGTWGALLFPELEEEIESTPIVLASEFLLGHKHRIKEVPGKAKKDKTDRERVAEAVAAMRANGLNAVANHPDEVAQPAARIHNFAELEARALWEFDARLNRVLPEVLRVPDVAAPAFQPPAAPDQAINVEMGQRHRVIRRGNGMYVEFFDEFGNNLGDNPVNNVR